MEMDKSMSMSDHVEVMSGETIDIAKQRRDELKQLFPGVFTETTDSQGDVIETVDFERLKAELGTFTDVYEGRRERYGMDWPGKRDCMKLIQEPTRATLKPCREESVDFDNTKNLFIEGDNLEVLKLLQKSYYGKVKMIYVDPPYNTGKEFIYPDNYQESIDTYLTYAGLLDDEGKKFSTNTASEGRFHTKWLNMMYPRLYLARNLLREDGVIFISIDDNEVENLRRVCNEIFGEENFIASIVWQKRTSPDSRANLGAGHDYLLVYARSEEEARKSLNKLPLKESRKAAYKNPDNDPRGPWSSENLTGQTGHATSSQFYKVETPTGIFYAPPEGRCWALAERTFLKLKEDNRIWFGESGNNRPRLKRFLAESDGMMSWTWWPNDEVGHNQEGTKEVKDLLGAGDVFNNPKPTRLIDRLLHLATDKDDLVLDFFAGSCSTAHAVLKKNMSDMADRRFIMIQLPEKCDPGSEACKAGYKTI
ncbi:MAG: site-specific DNA-methyltransferase, partial [Bermanella sp.]